MDSAPPRNAHPPAKSCAKAACLLAEPDPGEALFTWLRAVGAPAAANRGLGRRWCTPTTRRRAGPCHDMITRAGDALLVRAAGVVRPEITIARSLKLVSAISLVAEREPDGAAEAERLLAIAVHGVRAR